MRIRTQGVVRRYEIWDNRGLDRKVAEVEEEGVDEKKIIKNTILVINTSSGTSFVHGLPKKIHENRS